MRVFRSEFGAGMLLFASVLLALKLSFLPIRTSHPGPPDCNQNTRRYINYRLKAQLIGW